LLFVLLFSPAILPAQNDTTVLADSLLPVIQENPTEEPSTDEEPGDAISADDTDENYFLKKWESPRDSLFVQRKVPDSLLHKMQKDDDFWYANAEIPEEKKPEQRKSTYIPLGQQQWVQTLLWLVIIGGFAAGVIWYLSGSNVGLFRRKNKAIRNTNEEEPATEDIFAINYVKEIGKAESNGNYRLAIRLMFLKLLKEMAEKNIIQYKQDRTNFDYLLQLQPTGYYKNFFRITRNYEYSWYGQFEVGEDAYRIIRNDFNQFDRQLS